MMTFYKLLTFFHIAFGTLALISFWTAGLARKGSPLHVRSGKMYLLSMAALLLPSVPMSVIILIRGNPVSGSFLLYLVLITLTAVWLSWRAIRDKRDWAKYTGPVYRVLMWANLLAGLAMVVVGLGFAKQMQVIIASFSLIGISTFVRLYRFSRQPPSEPRWWMRQHLNAMLGNGVATHIAFLSIGMPRLLPMISGPMQANLAWLGPIVVALLAGAYLGRKYLGSAPKPLAAH